MDHMPSPYITISSSITSMTRHLLTFSLEAARFLLLRWSSLKQVWLIWCQPMKRIWDKARCEISWVPLLLGPQDFLLNHQP